MHDELVLSRGSSHIGVVGSIRLGISSARGGLQQDNVAGPRGGHHWSAVIFCPE